MRHMGGCTECFTVWYGCRCPLRCEECGAGYRDDGNSNCGTPGCKTGQRRHWAMLDRWEALQEVTPAEIQCEAVEPAQAQPEREERNVTPLPADEGGAVMTPPQSRPTERRRPGAKAHTDRRTPQPSKPAHRPVAERRAAVEALLAEGLSDREIARRAGVSPSTVSAVRKAQGATKIGA
jgi:hypothetical protein